jgi:hypothetical protein
VSERREVMRRKLLMMSADRRKAGGSKQSQPGVRGSKPEKKLKQESPFTIRIPARADARRTPRVPEGSITDEGRNGCSEDYLDVCAGPHAAEISQTITPELTRKPT